MLADSSAIKNPIIQNDLGKTLRFKNPKLKSSKFRNPENVGNPIEGKNTETTQISTPYEFRNNRNRTSSVLKQIPKSIKIMVIMR